MTPDALNRLVAQLAKLPGIGEKTAQRLAFHVLRAPPEYTRELVTALEEVRDKVRLCARCFGLSEGELCSMCQDTRRDERVLCVVESVADLMAVDRRSCASKSCCDDSKRAKRKRSSSPPIRTSKAKPLRCI
jgi:recombination protein RecR